MYGLYFVMRGQRGPMGCGFGFRGKKQHPIVFADSATDILDKQYASGELEKDEYKEKKRILSASCN